MTQTVVLVVEFGARPETVDELRELLLDLVVQTRAEEGCLRYDLHAHSDDPSRLTFVEEWASAEALARHDGTPWVAALREQLPRLVAEEARFTRLVPLEPAAEARS